MTIQEACIKVNGDRDLKWEACETVNGTMRISLLLQESPAIRISVEISEQILGAMGDEVIKQACELLDMYRSKIKERFPNL